MRRFGRSLRRGYQLSFAATVILLTCLHAPSQAVNVSVTVVNSTSLSVSWGVPESPQGEIEFYQVEYSSQCSSTVRMNTSSNITEAVLSRLSPFTEYRVRVRAFTVEFGDFSMNQTATTDEDVPSAAPEYSVTAVNATSITITWQPLPPCEQNGVITNYIIAYRMEGGMDMSFSEIVVNAPNCMHVVESLTPYTNYTIKMAASTSIGRGQFGPEMTVQTNESTPSEPLSFTVVNVNSTTIMVSWQPPAMPNGVVTGYFVWYMENLTCNNSQVSTSSRAELLPTADTHTFTELEEDTDYVFYVSAETSAGEGEAAMVMERTSEDVPATAPVVVITSVTATNITVTWQPLPPCEQNGVVTNYTIAYRMEGRTVGEIVVDAPNRMHVVEPLTPYTNYSIKMAASTSVGRGDFGSEMTVQTNESTPSEPQNFTVVSVTSTAIMVSWQPPAMPNGVIRDYNVWYDQTLNCNGSLVSFSDSVTGSVLMYTFTELEEDTLYVFYVSAETSAGEGEAAMVMERTSEDVPSAAPELNITSVTATNITITWQPLPPCEQNGVITNYTIAYRMEGEMDMSFSEIVVDDTRLMHVVESLTPYTNYSIKMAASTLVGRGDFGPEVTVQTDESTPSEPLSFTVVSVTSTAIMVSWQPPAMPNGVVTGYFVWYMENLTCNNSQVSTSSRAELAPTADTHTFTELEEDTVYVFYVSAETSAGEGEAAMVTGRTSEDVPSAAPEFNITAVTTTSINITWQPLPPCEQNGVITSYIIAYRMEGGMDMSFSEIVVVAANRMHVVDLLTPYTNYTIKMAASTSVDGDSLDQKQQFKQMNELLPYLRALQL